MSIEVIRQVLAWCSLFNVIVLLVWWLSFVLARDAIHTLHGKWFRLSSEQFDAIHYGGMAAYKGAIILLNLVPYLALRIVG